jgi:tRNA-dependent cyclodipeptide synthase
MKKIFNATKKEIEDRKNNIFIGISLGVLKPLTNEMAKEYIKWALKNTKGKVAVLIADEIAKFNYRVFSRYSNGKAERRAIKEGDKYISFFNQVIGEFPAEIRGKVLILRWKDIWDENKERIKKILEEEYKSNKDFKKQIQFFLREYSNKRNRKLNDEELDYLSQYILNEMSTLLDGIEHNNEKYRIILYPTFKSSGMSEVVTRIESGNIFKDLKKRLNLPEKTIMVETYL